MPTTLPRENGTQKQHLMPSAANASAAGATSDGGGSARLATSAASAAPARFWVAGVQGSVLWSKQGTGQKRTGYEMKNVFYLTSCFGF